MEGGRDTDVHFDGMATSAHAEDGDETTVWTLGKVPGRDPRGTSGIRRKEEKLTREADAYRNANCGWKRRGRVRSK